MKFLPLLMLLALISCSDESKTETKQNSARNLHQDTIVVKEKITSEISGLAYRKMADRYCIVVGKDTSTFKPIFAESIESGIVSLRLNIPYSKASVSYSQRLAELTEILKKAKTEYQLDSLKWVSYDRLILSGDLAVKVTEEFNSQFEFTNQISTEKYKLISDFLLSSTLAKDLNRVLKPYHKSVKVVRVEKVFYTTKDELLKYAQLEMDTSLIPEKIIDFMTWIELK